MSKVKINKDYILSRILIFSIKLKKIFKQIVKKLKIFHFLNSFTFIFLKEFLIIFTTNNPSLLNLGYTYVHLTSHVWSLLYGRFMNQCQWFEKMIFPMWLTILYRSSDRNAVSGARFDPAMLVRGRWIVVNRMIHPSGSWEPVVRFESSLGCTHLW